MYAENISLQNDQLCHSGQRQFLLIIFNIFPSRDNGLETWGQVCGSLSHLIDNQSLNFCNVGHHIMILLERIVKESLL
ncbi:hypothetical protein OUZ56_033627 [Daphnia magna]|uniref:Uncharacterized protein n=1 Tax=Daphnia magna TaxID=35525 RepID=A0ABQ9ZY37_9CRUS|nr:hypothetical protein OUZ56_033627 [Daphnia magna]